MPAAAAAPAPAAAAPAAAAGLLTAAAAPRDAAVPAAAQGAAARPGRARIRGRGGGRAAACNVAGGASWAAMRQRARCSGAPGLCCWWWWWRVWCDTHVVHACPWACCCCWLALHRRHGPTPRRSPSSKQAMRGSQLPPQGRRAACAGGVYSVVVWQHAWEVSGTCAGAISSLFNAQFAQRR
jgi:hypothetical protein